MGKNIIKKGNLGFLKKALSIENFVYKVQSSLIEN